MFEDPFEKDRELDDNGIPKVLSEDEKKVMSHIKDILEIMGEDPDRDGLQRTPWRWYKAMRELTVGYDCEPAEIINRDFEITFSGMCIWKGIRYWSLCEHHMLPFWGRAYIGIIPKGDRVIGLDKMPKMIWAFARRLQTQEAMAEDIANAIEDKLEPKGVIVILTGRHMCKEMRGVMDDSPFTTPVARGSFLKAEPGKDPKSEFLQAVGEPLC